MNPLRLIQSVAAAVLAALAVQAAGQNMLEIIALRHRTADQVLPALRGLLEPGATLSGQGNQLFLRTSPDNLSDIRRALDAIDRPLRRLQISVRFDDALDAASQGVEASGRISNRSARVYMRAHDARTSSTERVDQRIQVLEGGRAFISTGQSTPVLQGTVIRETATGFETVPRLAGERVFLDIAPRRETHDHQQYLATTVSARLGEWVEVGGAVESASREDRAILGSSRSRSAEARRVWLKVEEMRP
jgi:type II secretory pathway component GspD/PulD (secretin)